MLDDENMQRLLKSQEGKKPVAVLKTHTQGMSGYTPYTMQHGLHSPKSTSKHTNEGMPPISAGEPQRSLIKGRGQYYKNYQNMAYPHIGNLAAGAGPAEQLSAGPQPKLGPSGLHEEYLVHADDYASKLLAGAAKGQPQPGAVEEAAKQQDGAAAKDDDPLDKYAGLQDDRGAPAAPDKPLHGGALQQSQASHNFGKLKSSSMHSTTNSNRAFTLYGTGQPAKPVKKTNVLTGATSTSYQYPVIWAGQYMGLVGYQVQKENEENEKRLQQLQELATNAALRKQEQKKTTVSLPMRGRHMLIGDRR